jgi:hypothetical protein
VLFRYERVWLPDDDIAADVESVERWFELFEKRRLATCQPAIDRGDVMFRTLRVQPGYVLRYSRFVESMCRLFTASGECWRDIELCELLGEPYAYR